LLFTLGTSVASINGSPFASADHILIRADLARAAAGSADAISFSEAGLEVADGRDREGDVEEGNDKENNNSFHDERLGDN